MQTNVSVVNEPFKHFEVIQKITMSKFERFMYIVNLYILNTYPDQFLKMQEILKGLNDYIRNCDRK